jgi:acyl transferase domain-containing protein
MALAGGVNVMTNPNLFQNLSAASFLDPTGTSKAFDKSANGYSRGEGAGLFILKPLSQAMMDGDDILGVICGSAINQGSNCSPLTQSDPLSQNLLYKQVLKDSGVEPREITYVEAHGTGMLSTWS